jgi:NADH-quinone oxidoreductase subunit C
VRVDRSVWRETVRGLRDRGFTYFSFLSGIDWQPAPDLATRYELVFEPPADTPAPASGPEVEPAAAGGWTTGIAGGDSRFQVFCRVGNIETGVGVTLKADLDEANPEIDSLIPIFRGADWHERETWEMFGFIFTGHPDLRHLYLPGEFEGFPLRKDFPLLAREVKPWPGLVDVEPIPGAAGGDDEEGEG